MSKETEAKMADEDLHKPIDLPATPFLRRIDWASFLTSALVALFVYVITLGPSVTLEDSGELAVAGDHLGVPHPPGYPIWTMLAWVFTRVFSFVTFRGQPTPAWSISLMSGVFGALAAGITAMLITRVTSDMLEHARSQEEEEAHKHDNVLAWVAGVSGSLVFAFSPVMWSQATIVEVYTLNAFFLMLIFLLTYRWMRRPSERLLWIICFVFGLGLTNYQVLLLAMLPLIIVIMLRDARLFRDFLMAGMPFVLGLLIMKWGAEGASATFTKHSPGEVGFFLPKYFKPLVNQTYYLTAIIGGLLAIGGSAALALRPRRKDEKFYDFEGNPAWLIGGGAAILFGFALMMWAAVAFPAAAPYRLPPNSQVPVPYSWRDPSLIYFGAIFGLFALGALMKRGIWYATAIGAIFMPMYFFMRRGGMLGLYDPTTGWFLFYILLNFVVLALAWTLLPRGRTVVISILCAQLGVAFYIYMPLSSETNPPMNWGYPRTWEGFKHAITRGQYEKLKPVSPLTVQFLKQIGFYFWEMRMQFTLLIAPLGLIPFSLWSVRSEGTKRIRGLYISAGLYVGVVFLVLLSNIFGYKHNTERFQLEMLLILLMLVPAGLGFFASITEQVRELLLHVFEEQRQISERVLAALVAIVVSVLVICVPILLFGKGFDGIFLAVPRALRDPNTSEALVAAARSIQGGSLNLLLIGVVYALLLGGGTALALMKPADFRIEIDSIMQKWFLASFTGFVVMSVLLIALANPRCDVQDAFIQKVKFISSHGLFALWIGYAIAMGLMMLSRLLKEVPKLGLVAMMLALVLPPMVPVYENYTNDKLIELYGAANQDGHDFGWQFGNYQLRGAEAITEELEPREEPLPNPYFPEGMTTNAIFYGGTDPGRFVPTYMIYSAVVRPDVFLITQNALADGTYMSVMRDLYGDDIWIPSPEDSAKAFRIYVDEVESGKRPKNADLKIINGRVQVTGALGVMEINGVLCEMMHSRNKALHDFYVEESYQINWMFPYLTPHGLILKLNDEKCGISVQNRNDDMDFWDWYVRRLTSSPKFRRDIVAKKSFSKLRSAIAGLYARRGHIAEAERGYTEARALYKYSPEAAFRLTQEVFLPRGRFGDAQQVLERLSEIDPNNRRIDPLLRQVKQIGKLNAEAEAINRRVLAGDFTTKDLVKLVELHHDLRIPGRMLTTVKMLVQRPDLHPQDMIKVIALLGDFGRFRESVPLLDRLAPVLLSQKNPMHRIQLANMYARAQETEKGRLLLADAEKILMSSGKPDANVLMALADAYKTMKDWPKTEQVLQQCIKVNRTNWLVWLELADARMAQKKVELAKTALTEAIRLGRQDALNQVMQRPALTRLAGEIMQERQRLPRPGTFR